jgi:hypothetical protein
MDLSLASTIVDTAKVAVATAHRTIAKIRLTRAYSILFQCSAL